MTDKLENVKINISGKEYFITPISIEFWRGIRPLHGDFATDNSTEFIDKTINVLVKTIHAALLPTYPDMTEKEVAEILHFDKEDSLAINPGQIKRKLEIAGPIMETILKISSLTWEWNPQITRH
jgi:hypothetical protein